ncbi:MAG: beta-hexosaminidase [Agathobacter sp.]|nr:beta-hexosaminidase [Agathobacter sp.]
MVNLKEIPYCLSDEDIAWVENTIANMTEEEKVGQLFFDNRGMSSEEELIELVTKYHIGGYRYNGIKADRVQYQVRVLQENSKIPLFVACNPEDGGNGSATNGTYIGKGIKIGATRNEKYAYEMGRMANEEAAAMGNNMAFAPVCDIHYNWQNTEVVKRAFGNDPEIVAKMSKAYMDGVHTVPGYASVAKHFPGNGQDFRDAHQSSNINEFTKKEWMETYGMVYKTLIDGGVEGIMGGHIMLPKYMREVKPNITDDEMMPATLCKEILTGLLRDELGFNGVVISDATHMVAMTNRMCHADMIVESINAGNDMFLFFNDPDEDFGIMLDAYKTGKMTEERMAEALTRILGLKAKMGLNKKAKKDIVPAPEEMNTVLNKPEYTELAKAIAKDSITLVKYKDKDVLPITPEKYKRIMIVYVKGNDGAMAQLMKFAFGGGGPKNPAEVLCEKLQEKGFDAYIYESPMDKMKKAAADGKEIDYGAIYRIGKSAIKDFKEQQDLVITVYDVETGRPNFGMSKGGGEIPWYVHDMTTIGISVNTPTMLADVPTVRTYINAYDSKDYTMDALVEKLMTGPEAFTGKDPIDSFCGLWDTRI